MRSLDFTELTLEQLQQFQRDNTPVVLRGALRELPAWGKWSLGWFKEAYGGSEVEVSLDGAQDGPKKVMPLGEYIASVEQAAAGRPPDECGCTHTSGPVEAAAAAGGVMGSDDSSYLPYLRAWQFDAAHPELMEDLKSPAASAHGADWLARYFLDKLKRLPKHVRCAGRGAQACANRRADAGILAGRHALRDPALVGLRPPGSLSMRGADRR